VRVAVLDDYQRVARGLADWVIDGEQLAALMIRYDVGVRIEETFHIKKVDEDFFLE
jgi:restriction endonuclease Mrr